MERRVDIWLPGYLLGAPARMSARRARRDKLTHVFFLVCDHYEPRHKAKREGQAWERVETWRREYPAFQARCRERFGHAPLHTWFYPPHHGPEHLPQLADMAHGGGGEIELHYHHSDDTAETLARDLRGTLALYRRHGLLIESGEPPRTSFGFVHGDWTLDNACNGRHCGVNGELSILRNLGCWGDFTMPSGNDAQTRKTNAIYYAVDDPARHKSHDSGIDAAVGRTDTPGFFLMQGPLAINWRAPGYPRIENASLTSENWGRPDRVRAWLDAQVHVHGRPEWLFVKLHTHGAVERDFDALFGEKAMRMHETLNELCNDGTRYQLHYVTAREAYNLAKAAERGLGGDPRQWLDLVVDRPATHWYALGVEHEVAACTGTRLRIADVEPAAANVLKTRVGALREVRGAFSAVAIDATAGAIEITVPGAGELILVFEQPVQLEPATTVGMVQPASAARDAWRLDVRAAGTASLRYDVHASAAAATVAA
jgi:hypothetical protein